jgi:F-box protein 9
MPGRHYKRGLAPYVFVPWEHIQDSPLNLPIAKMDFYVPG